MSEEVKFEMIFGDPDLIKYATKDVVAASINPLGQLMHFTAKSLEKLSRDDLVLCPILAMRRIIRTPVWTKADQQAGKLPEVGCDVQFKSSKKRFKLVVKGSDGEYCGQDGHELFLCWLGDIEPIETEAERQQREENEVVASILNDEMPDSSLQWRCIFERGVRAAYRKLKMPEVRK